MRHRMQGKAILEGSDTDNVTVRVIPFDLDGFGGSWTSAMLAGGAVPKLDTAVGDASHAAAFIDCEAQLGVFRTLFRRVEGMSLDPGRSRDFIDGLVKEL